MGDFPCRKLPMDQWCDRLGVGDFMVHTCVPTRVKLTRDELLILLIEECGEVIQAATKCLRFGFDVDHGIDYGNNRMVLSREVGDVLGVIDALPLDRVNIEVTRTRKIAKAEAAKTRYGADVGSPSEPGK